MHDSLHDGFVQRVVQVITRFTVSCLSFTAAQLLECIGAAVTSLARSTAGGKELVESGAGAATPAAIASSGSMHAPHCSACLTKRLP